MVCKYSYEQITHGTVQKGICEAAGPRSNGCAPRDRPNPNLSISLCPLALLTPLSPNIKLGQWALPVSWSQDSWWGFKVLPSEFGFCVFWGRRPGHDEVLGAQGCWMSRDVPRGERELSLKLWGCSWHQEEPHPQTSSRTPQSGEGGSIKPLKIQK